ncbi:hypothetical protein AB0K20_18045 [Micromonospora matsumotoense]|uniref:hypothetical protein n=1 Tax=Micromonospora matsumotoense TaxID=121616 RepID=UPI00342A5BB2
MSNAATSGSPVYGRRVARRCGRVLSAVANVARAHGITVLGTCQDAVMPDAASYCGEILYFCYPSKADALNLSTRMFGFDDNGERVELSADHLLIGRRIH